MRLKRLTALTAAMSAGLMAVTWRHALRRRAWRRVLRRHEDRVPSASADLTARKFLALREGMAYPDVVAVLGAVGREVSRIESPRASSVTFEWLTADGAGAVHVVFQGSTLVAKVSRGLR
jgi:hypothetical protein